MLSCNAHHTSCHVMSCHVMSCHVMCPITSLPTNPCIILELRLQLLLFVFRLLPLITPFLPRLIPSLYYRTLGLPPSHTGTATPSHHHHHHPHRSSSHNSNNNSSSGSSSGGGSGSGSGSSSSDHHAYAQGPAGGLRTISKSIRRAGSTTRPLYPPYFPPSLSLPLLLVPPTPLVPTHPQH